MSPPGRAAGSPSKNFWPCCGFPPPLRRALQKYIEEPLSELLIQGTLPRPAELEVYLGDTGIFYRQINAEAEAVTAGGPVEPVPGTLLYTF